MSPNNRPQALAVVGPTASGKSSIAIELAKKYNGEIVSCDSRQVYRGMDKGTGKVPRDKQQETGNRRQGIKKKQISISLEMSRLSHVSCHLSLNPSPYLSEGIPHWMIDIVNPSTPYNVAKFQKKANAVIRDILNRGKLPILCGGTGLWAQAVVENMTFPAIAPDTALRNKLRNTSTEKLFSLLRKLNPERARTIDPKNRHRLIRAIEITGSTEHGARIAGSEEIRNAGSDFSGNPSPTIQVPRILSGVPRSAFRDPYHWLILVVNPSREILFEKIEKRLDERFEDGMIDEVAMLHKKQKLSWARLDSFGLEYRWITRYLQKKLSFPEMRQKLLTDIRHYAKRQLTWLRRWEKAGRTLHWISSASEAKQLTQNFLKK